MAGLFEYLLQKATGKRRSDINLPNESGQVDPRLGQTGDTIREGVRTLKDLASSSNKSVIKQLQEAGKRGMDREAEAKRFRDENRKAAGR